MFFFIYIFFSHHTHHHLPPSPLSLALFIKLWRHREKERERHGGWALTLYRESSSFSSPLPKYGQCQREKVHVRVSVREARRGGAKGGEAEKGEEKSRRQMGVLRMRIYRLKVRIK